MTVTNAIITSYCYGLITANGHIPKQGLTIAAPRNIPFNTHIRVEGLTNDFIVQDRMNKRFPLRFDIYMTNHEDCIKWGIQTRKIEVVVK